MRGSCQYLRMLEQIREFIPRMLREEEWLGVGFRSSQFHSMCAVRELEMNSLNLRILISRIEALEDIPANSSSTASLRAYKAPFAMQVLSGEFDMHWGQGTGPLPPATLSREFLAVGDCYEFDVPSLWHSVELRSQEVLALIVLGPKFKMYDTPPFYSEPYFLEPSQIGTLLTAAELAL